MKKLILIILLCPALLYSQWIQQTVPSDIDLLRTIDFINSNTGVVAGWSGTYILSGRVIYTTNSGINWYNAQIPDSSQGFMKVQLVTSSIGYLAGAYTPIYKNTYSKIQKSNEKRIKSSNPKQLHRYFEYYNFAESLENYKGMFLKTTNGGQSWFTLDYLPANVYSLGGMCFLNQNTGFVTASLNYYSGIEEAILKTTNGGLNWNTLTTVDSINIGNIFTPDGNAIVVVGRKVLGGPSNVKGLLIKSGDAGQSWTIEYISNIYSFWDVYFTNSTTGFVAGGDVNNQAVIYKTTNAGLNWYSIYSLGPLCVYYGIDFNNSGTGFAVGYKVQYMSIESMLISRTTNYGSNWSNLFIPDTSNFLLANCIADQNTWFASGGDLLGNGLVLKTTTGGVSIQPISNEIPDKFSLHQNYPNPFNPSTKIRFDLHKTAHAKLIVFDALGRELATLVDEELKVGGYEVNFDGSNNPSGVYFYRLETNNFIETKRMVLLK